MSNSTSSWQSTINICLVGAFLLGGVYLWSGKSDNSGKDDVPKPVVVSPSKALEEAYRSDRASKISILQALVEQGYDSNETTLKFFNSESEKRRAQDFKLYGDIVAEAIDSQGVDKLLRQLEAGK